MPLIFYDTEREADGYAVRLMLGLLRLPHEHIPCDGTASPPAPAPFPPGPSLPALVDGPLVLREVEAILTYLVRRYDWRDQWLPADEPDLFGQTMMWLCFAGNALRTLRGDTGNRDRHRSIGEANRELLVVEGHMARRQSADRAWLVGRTPTVADVAVFAALVAAEPSGVDPCIWPATFRWMEAVRGLPGFADTPLPREVPGLNPDGAAPMVPHFPSATLPIPETNAWRMPEIRNPSPAPSIGTTTRVP